MAAIRPPADFRDFLKLLNSHRVEYLLIGGYAACYHGAYRNTGDIDFSRAFTSNGLMRTGTMNRRARGGVRPSPGAAVSDRPRVPANPEAPGMGQARCGRGRPPSGSWVAD